MQRFDSRFPRALILLTVLLLALTACGAPALTADVGHGGSSDTHEAEAADAHDEGEAMAMGDEHDHAAHIHADPPAAYADLINPLAGDEEAIAAGAAVFQENCLRCHGETGAGDGPDAAALAPAPADLSDAVMMADLSDGYLFWRVSEGGAFAPFLSQMPAWADTLSEEMRWQVISYLRTLSE